MSSDHSFARRSVQERLAVLTTFRHLYWRRILFAGFLAELLVFAIVFPVLYFFGQRPFLASILIASTLIPFLFALWVGRALESRFVLHGALIGLVAALLYMAVAWGQPQPLLYQVAHGLKVLGGMAGGWLVQLRQRRRLMEPPVKAPSAL